MALTPASGSIPFTVTTTLIGTTLLSNANPLNYAAGGNGLPAGNFVNGGVLSSMYYYTGRSDNFAAGSSQIENNGRLDVEGIRASADGKSVFVSDEYGPYLYQFDRVTGSLLKNEDKGGSLGNTTGRVQNKGWRRWPSHRTARRWSVSCRRRCCRTAMPAS